MRNVPPSIRSALKKNGQDAILQQEGDYAQFKDQIYQMLHGDEPLQSKGDKYDSDIETPIESRGKKEIEAMGDKYRVQHGDKVIDFNSPEEMSDYVMKNPGSIGGRIDDDFDEDLLSDADMEEDIYADARPNHNKVIDMIDDDLINDDVLDLMVRKYVGEDYINKLAEEQDIFSDEVLTSDLLKSMSDDDIGDMLVANGLDDTYDDILSDEDMEDLADYHQKQIDLAQRDKLDIEDNNSQEKSNSQQEYKYTASKLTPDERHFLTSEGFLDNEIDSMSDKTLNAFMKYYKGNK